MANLGGTTDFFDALVALAVTRVPFVVAVEVSSGGGRTGTFLFLSFGSGLGLGAGLEATDSGAGGAGSATEEWIELRGVSASHYTALAIPLWWSPDPSSCFY